MKRAIILLATLGLLVGCDSNRTGEGAMGGPGSDSSTRLGGGGSGSKSDPNANSGPQNSITNGGALGSASAPTKYSNRTGPSAASTSGAPLTNAGPRLDPGKETNPDKQ